MPTNQALLLPNPAARPSNPALMPRNPAWMLPKAAARLPTASLMPSNPALMLPIPAAMHPKPRSDASQHSSEASPPNADASHPNAGRARSIICTCFFSVCEVHNHSHRNYFRWRQKQLTKCNPPVKSKQSTLHQFSIIFAGVSCSRFRSNWIPHLLVHFPMGRVVEVVGAAVVGVAVPVLLQLLPWTCSRGLLRNALI